MTQVHVPSMTSRPASLARSMTSGRTPWARMTTAAPWSTSSSGSTVCDAERLQLADDALVVDDLAEGMGRLAGGRGLLGLVDRFADAVAEPGPLGDADFLDRSRSDYRTRSTRAPSPA